MKFRINFNSYDAFIIMHKNRRLKNMVKNQKQLLYVVFSVILLGDGKSCGRYHLFEKIRKLYNYQVIRMVTKRRK